MYKITLTGLTFYGYHGASKAEKELGQRFVIDLEIESDLEEAANSDNLEKTINCNCGKRKQFACDIYFCF